MLAATQLHAWRPCACRLSRRGLCWGCLLPVFDVEDCSGQARRAPHEVWRCEAQVTPCIMWRAQACPARLLQIHHLLVLEPGELDLDVGVICPLVVEIGLHELGVGVGVDRETLVRPLECSVVGIVYASQLAGVTFAVRSDPHTTGTPGVVVSVRHPTSSAAVHRHFVLQCGESVLP